MEVSDSTFNEEVIKKSYEVPVVVDFWAPWCMPCRMLGPVLEDLEKEYGGRFILAKVNVDENPKLSQLFRIMSIPSVKLFKDGKVVDEFVGALPRELIKVWLEKHL